MSHTPTRVINYGKT